MTERRPLAGLDVLEHGSRIAVAACGSVLAALGANVSVVVRDASTRAALPAAHREGKREIRASTPDAVAAAIDRAAVLIGSSDVDPLAAATSASKRIVCDITAYGSSGPLAGTAHSDAMIQALTGLADTTGEPDGPPTLCPFPQVEGLAALYAAAGILAAVEARDRTAAGAALEIALFDCAFSTLTTFLPFHFVGQSVTRAGNRHVLASPWNAYRARDAWLLICTGSDEQWRRLCEVIGRSALGTDPALAKAADRVRHRDRVDAAVQAWIAAIDAADAAARLQAHGIAAGAVVAANALALEPNVAHRGVYTAAGMRSAIRYFGHEPAGRAPEPREPDARASRWPASETAVDGPLTGIKVLELGQYTTAPLVARNLGALGAQVLKIEPPGGDATRAWPPQRDGQGYFFALSNSDKRSLCLDLRVAGDRRRFEELLAAADLLVENLKPGSLDKLGLDAAARRRISPRLVYCAISGFGADSAYPGRPAFDTVVQAMSGIMDLVRVNGVPQKTGVSYADVLGGLFGLVATLAALIGRRRFASAEAIDISMQDAAAWITQWTSTQDRSAAVLQCADGYVCTQGVALEAFLAARVGAASRAQAVRMLREAGRAAVPVLSVAEAAESPQAIARALVRHARDSHGREWPVLASPIRWRGAAQPLQRAIGPLGEANASGASGPTAS